MKAFDTLHIRVITVLGDSHRPNCKRVMDRNGAIYHLNKINIKYR